MGVCSLKIVEVSHNVPDRIGNLMTKAYHLVPLDNHLYLCPNSMWEKMKSTVKNLASDVTHEREYNFQERSMIFVKEIVKSAEVVSAEKIRIKSERSRDLTGKLLVSGGECPFCRQSKMAFLSFEKENGMVCLACKRRMVIINSDSLKDFDKLFPEIYKIV